jgi:hypothetical protein
MRILFGLLVLLGGVGLAFGVLTIIQNSSGPTGLPFRFENSGGPGPIIAGLFLISGGLYLLSFWRERDR